MKKKISYIIDIFYGFQEDIYKCAYCSYATYNYQGFSVLNLHISCPKYFIINFKRIGENCFYNHNVQIPSNFGVNNLVNGVFYEYILTGFIKHYGGGSSGHNIAICNNVFDSFWYFYKY